MEQGYPLNPTLCGVFIDALEDWLGRPAVAVVSPKAATLIYADDLALLAICPLPLQELIDALADFCSSAGSEISAAKTNEGDANPPPPPTPPHTGGGGGALLLHAFVSVRIRVGCYYILHPYELFRIKASRYSFLLIQRPLRLYGTSTAHDSISYI